MKSTLTISIFIATLLFCNTVSCQSTNTHKPKCRVIDLFKYSISLKDSTIESGIIFKKRKIICNIDTVGYKNKYYIIFKEADVFFYCDSINHNKPFNGIINRKRVGVWFKWNIFGKLRKATAYLNGRKVREIVFWSNGNPKNTYLYIGKKTDVQEYFKDGSPDGGWIRK